MSAIERHIIIGGGQAGAQGAASLRQAGFEGEIVIFSAENTLPYQRPPLSKAYLKGDLARERLFLRPTEFFERQRIDVRLGNRIRLIDRGEKRVIDEDGDEHGYDKLLIATGAPPRRLSAPGADLDGVFYLRTLMDSDALRTILTCEGRIIIVGAGYIGLEVAAVARQAGRNVTVLEMADRPLARVAGEPVSDFFRELHEEAGVDLRFGAALKSFVGEGGWLKAAVLTSGEEIDCEAALIGIGAEPAVSLAAEARLEIANGIVVDESARTSDEAIWAAGDCANFPSARYGRRLRLESVPNAIEQAKVAGANMAGGDAVYDALPWFWSDQYDVKLQTAGLCEGADDSVIRGDPKSRRFAVWHLKEGAPLAVDAINDPASFAIGKRLISDRAAVERDALADSAFDLKKLIAPAR